MAVFDKSNADALKKNRESYQDWLKNNSGNHYQQATSAIVPITADSAHRRANNSEYGVTNSMRQPMNSFLVSGPAVTSNADKDKKDQKDSGRRSYTVNAGNQPYVDQLNALYDQIMNRKPFQYDLNGDLLYRQMADRYTQMGQQAMRDATGTAAGLTGGYGNSFATQVGNQAYQQYLTALNDNIPQLYDRAYQAYQDQGNQLLQQYELAAAHPGYIDAIKPRTYTVADDKTDDDTADMQAYLAALKNSGLLVGAMGGAQAPTVSNQATYNYEDYLKKLMEQKS